MSQPLIFTEQRLLPRAIDVLLTIFAWIAFLHLIHEGLVVALMEPRHMEVRPFLTTLDTVTFYIFIALMNGLFLIGWAKYNQFRFKVERRKRRPGCEHHEIAESLQISPSLVMEMSKGKHLTVYHHDSGHISYVVVEHYMADNLLPSSETTLLELQLPFSELTVQIKGEHERG